MPKFRITNLDDAVEGTVVGRSTRTGQDGNVTTLGPGKSAVIDLDADNEAVIASPAVAGATTSIHRPDAVIESDEAEVEAEEEAPQLSDASDDEVREVLTTLGADTATARTTTGKLDMDAINKSLAEKGRNPILAARRDALTPAPQA